TEPDNGLVAGSPALKGLEVFFLYGFQIGNVPRGGYKGHDQGTALIGLAVDLEFYPIWGRFGQIFKIIHNFIMAAKGRAQFVPKEFRSGFQFWDIDGKT